MARKKAIPPAADETSLFAATVPDRASAPGAPAMSAAAPKSRKWTKDQKDAIDAAGTGLLVSAAAGSGKTSVLSERCAQLVCASTPRCNVSQLLVVTFTEAAAAEMKSRIEKAIRERAAADLSDPHLLRQLKLIEHANVSTLHGFCNRVLRQHFHRAGLDPNFAILDGDEAALLRADVVRQLFLEHYEKGDQPFQRFIDAYGSGNDEPLMDLVLNTHELLSSVIDPAAWTAEALRRIQDGADQPLEQSLLGKQYIGLVRERLAGLQERCRTAIHAMPPDFPKYSDYLAMLGATLESWSATLRNQGYDALASAAKAFSAPRMPTYPNTTAGKEQAQALLKSVQEEMKEGTLVESLAFTADEWRATLRAIAPHASVFLSLVSEFGEKYREAKREARGLDFGDLERLTLDLLRDAGKPGLVPSSIARSYHQQFRHVLVDEYQDINEVQDAILSLVSTECLGALDPDVPSNLFCVGDVKQSIYRFRLADPERFLHRHDLYKHASVANRGRVITLSANFRSRRALLETINHVFTRLMARPHAEIDYDDSHRLRAGTDYPTGVAGCFPGAPVELHLISDRTATPAGNGDNEASSPDLTTEEAELDRTEYEASFVTQRILQLLGRDGSAPAQVMQREGDGWSARALRPGDIVILLRSPRYKADLFAQALRAAGLPVHSDKGAGFFTAMEVQDVLALLKILDNRRQDIPLAAFLRSPLASLPQPEDALARVRIAYRAKGNLVPFHLAVVRYAAEQDDELAARLRDVLAQLDRWHALARQRPLSELLWTIFDETGYLAFCAGLEDGQQRVANLLHLHERAQQFGSFTRQGLYRFLRFLDNLQEQLETAAPSVASESDDVVRIMSVHASKGLEFPVVFLPDLGKQHNLQDSKRGILVDRVAFLGLQVTDEERQITYPSLAHRLVRERIQGQAMAEELRLLYVAMTRAKEHLILVGTCEDKEVETWRRKWAGHARALPGDEFLSAGTFLDWLGPVAMMLGQTATETLLITSHTQAEIAAGDTAAVARQKLSPQQELLARLDPLPEVPPPTQASQSVIARLGYRYPHEPFTRLPAVLSVTGWTKHGQAIAVRDGQDEPITATLRQALQAPRCSEESAAPSPTDRGSATHLVLQYLDFSRPCDAADLAGQFQRLIARKVLTPAQAEMVDRDAIAWMLGSEVGTLLRANAAVLRRELPFYLAQPPEGIDPVASSPDPQDLVMIRGRMDVVIPGTGGITVIDYKTDNVPPELVASRVETYRAQVTLYREALKTITGRECEAAYLVFLGPREIRRV